MSKPLLCLLLLAVCSPACTNVSSAMPPAASEALAPLQVQTVAVATEDVATWLLLTGQLKGSRETDLAANAKGRVVATQVERGQFVKAGQVLATLDVRAAALSASNAKAEAQTAEAQSETAKLECERASVLLAQGALSGQQADRLEAQCRTSALQVSAARARSQLAAQSVGDGMIRAPFAGFVAERYVEVGEYVQPETRVVTLIDPSSLRLELTIPESQIAAAQPGSRVRFSVAGYPDRRFEGTLKFVAASVRPGTRDILAEAIVDQPEGLLRSGMFAAVQLQSGSQRAAVIPRAALIARDGRSTAFVVKNGRAEQRIVQTGDTLDHERVVALRGLGAGESLVLNPDPELRNGRSVH